MASLAFDTGPEGPELAGWHKGIQRVYALSTPKEITPTAALRAAKRERRADAFVTLTFSFCAPLV